MRPRGSVWLSARKPPDITGVALTLQIRPRRPRQQARGGPGRPGLPRQHRQRARPGPKTQTPGVPPRPLLPLGAAGPWVGGGGWGTHCEIDLCAVAVLPVAVRRCGCVAR